MKTTLFPEHRLGQEAAQAPDYTLFDRTQHQPPRGIIATLDDLTGWTAEAEGLPASFGTTPAYALWGETGTFIEIAPVEKGRHQAGTLILRPPAPLPILPDAGFFELWICGDNFDWQQLGANFSLALLTRATGSATEERLMLAPCINWPTFALRMLKIPAALRGGNGVVTGLCIQGEAAATRRRIGLDRLCTCRDERPPLTFAPRPRRPVILPAGQTRGLNTGPGMLSFPTREETLLPDNFSDNFTTEVTQQDGSVIFRYRGDDAEVVYTWTPGADPLRVTIQVNGFPLGHAFTDAAWGDETRVETPKPIGSLALASLTVRATAATAAFTDPVFGALTLTLQILGKSLVFDLRNTAGKLAVFLPGQFTDLHHARVRKAPAMGDNAILIADTSAGMTCFCSLFHDWYRSNASSWRGQTTGAESSASLQGPLLYLPTTDGIRNGFFERYFLTCSPLYEEALPNIPNPASPWAKEAGRYVFQESWGPDTFEKELAKARHWAAFGMTDVLHLHHELGWSHNEPATPERDNQRYWVNDGCTLRLDIAPAKGGTEAMQRFLSAEKALGLRAGLYTNYTDYYTLNSRFRSDLPILLPDGSRQTAWVHSYAMKPALSVEFDAWFAPRIAERFRPTTAYTDVHTCVAPWQRVDFDARVPGAGTFAATYYAFGELLLNDQRHYAGPVFSEGGYHHWIYAGLVSGNYGQIIITDDDPPNPAFNLLKVHPLETDVGLTVGTTGWIKGPDNLDPQVDRYLLACLTYGHIAYLPEEPFDTRLLLRIYHLARAASHHTAGERPVSINYADADGRWMNLSEAQARGLDDHCRLRIIYPGDKVLYANWSRTQSWTLPRDRADAAILPPNGYRFESPHGLICASDEIDGHRCDRAETPGGWFLDGRGREMTWGPLTATGSVALLIALEQAAPWRLIDGGGNTTIRITDKDAPARLRALAEDGRVLSEFEPARDGDAICITPVGGAVRYERA